MDLDRMREHSHTYTNSNAFIFGISEKENDLLQHMDDFIEDLVS